METARDRMLAVSHQSRECYLVLEPLMEKVAKELQNSMELNHFLADLNDRMAINLQIRLGCRK